MIPVTGVLIVKNEQKTLKDCLRALKKLPIQILVCDTGSTDRTVEIALEYADKVIRFEWCNDFAAARNYAASEAMTDCVLFVDADEILKASDASKMFQNLEKHPKAVGQIQRINKCLSSSDQSFVNMTDMVERLYNRRYYHYEGRIHEQVVPLDSALYQKNANGSDALLVFDTGLTFTHEGYLGTPEERRRKAERNNALLKDMLKDAPEDVYLYYQIAESCILAGDYEQAYETMKQGFTFDVDPTLPFVRIMITDYGYSMIQTGRLEEAVSLASLSDAFGDYADFRCMLGEALMKLCRNAEAFEQFDAALSCTEAGVDGCNSFMAAHNAACILEEALYDYDRAIAYYKRSLDALQRPETKNRLTALQKRMAGYRARADISLCMICKNEEENLAACLEPFKDLPIEINIIDTGSTDRTKEIASRYTDRIFDFTWCNDFSAARNYSIECASHDWILVLDCDEAATKVPFYEMMALKEKYPQYVGQIIRTSPASDGTTTTDHVDRFFDRRLFHYILPIHEQLVHIDGTPHVDYAMPFYVNHTGYVTEELLQRKVARDKELLSAMEASPYSLFQLGHAQYLQGDYETAQDTLLQSIEMGFDPSMEYTIMLLVSLGNTYIALSQYTDGLERLKPFYDSFKGYSDYLYTMGRLYLLSGDISNAMLHFMQATMAPLVLTNDTRQALPNYQLGVICERLGDSGSAVSYYQKCGSYEPALDRISELT